MKEEEGVVEAVSLTKDDMAEHYIPYEEHQFADGLIVVGMAWSHDRVWFCINGLSVFRAKVVRGRLVPEYNKPDSIKEVKR
ncbi:hypothetical protein LCGC14_0483660 [marine sediment metagenome]|uniref:Uncharacterized protein n=1 Tax=marine sediment metagenome TaxID=412755 RepID=A0A0F9S8F1_9ZZZZ